MPLFYHLVGARQQHRLARLPEQVLQPGHGTCHHQVTFGQLIDQALRERLDDLQRRMKDLGMQGEDGLSDAEEAMREAGLDYSGIGRP